MGWSWEIFTRLSSLFKPNDLASLLLLEKAPALVQVLDALPDMVLVKGPRSRILWGNKAFRDYYGMTNEQLRGLVDAPFVEPDYTQQYVRDDLKVFTQTTVVDIPCEPAKRHDGVVRYFHTVKSPIFNAKGRVVMSVGVSRDITDRRT